MTAYRVDRAGIKRDNRESKKETFPANMSSPASAHYLIRFPSAQTVTAATLFRDEDRPQLHLVLLRREVDDTTASPPIG